MGYSRNPKKLEKVKPMLEQLLKTENDISWPTTNSHMLGYYIREAMTLASKDKDSPYKDLKGQFIIRDKGDRIVAERRIASDFVMQAVMTRMILADLETLYEIVGAAVQNRVREMVFPDAELNEEHLTLLYQWCQKNEYYLIAVTNQVGVTLTKNDYGDIAWTPEQSG